MDMIKVVLIAKFAVSNIDKIRFAKILPQLIPIGDMSSVVGLVSVKKLES